MLKWKEKCQAIVPMKTKCRKLREEGKITDIRRMKGRDLLKNRRGWKMTCKIRGLSSAKIVLLLTRGEDWSKKIWSSKVLRYMVHLVMTIQTNRLSVGWTEAEKKGEKGHHLGIRTNSVENCQGRAMENQITIAPLTLLQLSMIIAATPDQVLTILEPTLWDNS